MSNPKKTRLAAFDALKTSLMARQKLLIRILRDDLNGLGKYQIAQSSDVLDAAADTVSDAVNTGLIRCENEELAAVEDALERIDQGVYGGCDSCGKDIPLSRLRVVPFATECIKCRRKAEAKRNSPLSLWSHVSTDSMSRLG